jgi:pimeloyl-ACP methyl ester carboxylesterase
MPEPAEPDRRLGRRRVRRARRSGGPGAARLAVAAVAVGSAVALVAAGCTAGSHPRASTGSGGSGAPTGTSASASLHWQACSTGGGVRQLCGKIQVPLNYSDPGGRKITLALTEVPATAPASRRHGILLVNPGGPGGSGTSMASFVAEGLEPSVAAEYDIIGFDPRGVGASVPSMTCDPSFFARARPNYIPASPAAEQAMENRARTYAKDCEQKYGWLLPYLTTKNVARDMNQIRLAMGQSKLSYFGYSYGTYLGQVFATLFPHQLYRMVLDSTVNPQGVWYADNIAQDYAFQGRQNAFLAWVAKYDNLYKLGATQAQANKSWYEARTRLAAHPITNSAGVPIIGADEYDDTMLIGDYDNGYWPSLAAALAAYLHTGSTAQLVTLFHQIGAQSANEFAVYNAVECADVAWPRDWARWNTDARRVYSTAPVEAWDNLWFNAACAFWAVHGPAKPLRIGAPGLPGILMLQGTLDPATPYAGAQVAHRQLPTARMVVVEGGGNHGQSLAYPPNHCVNGYLNRYLASGTLPSGPGLVNATCAALPAPVPSG